MNDTTAPPRRLMRSATDRKVAGVAGGLGAYFGIDPVVIRIALVLATVFGGAGVIVYAVAWVIIPTDDGTTVLDVWPRADARRSGAIVLIGLAALLLLGQSVWADDLILPLLLIGAGAVLLMRPRPVAEPTVPGTVTPPPPPPAHQPPPTASPSGFPTGLATLGVVALVAGALGLLGSAGVGIELESSLLICTTLLGLGLVAGAFLGRARWLVAAAVPFFLVLSLLAAVDLPLARGIGERVYEPRTIAEVDDRYELGVGDLQLNLLSIPRDELARKAHRIEVRIGLGEVTVHVPPEVTVVVDGRIAAGQADLFGRSVEGADLELDGRRPGDEGAGTIVLTIEAGLGQVTVR